VRANSDDRVVVDEVPIGGRVGPSIRFFVASFSDGRLKRGCRVLILSRHLGLRHFSVEVSSHSF
jgi:hypothetical protein